MIRLKQLIKEAELSSSEKAAAIDKIGNADPEQLQGSTQSVDIAKNFKRSKDNKFTVKGSLYGKNDFMSWLKEPWAKDMFKQRDIDAIVYYFDKWPKKGNDIEMKGINLSHFVDIPPSHEKLLKQQWPDGEIEDYGRLGVYQWKENGKTRGIAHSLDDTWFLMTKIDDKAKFKIDDVLYISI